MTVVVTGATGRVGGAVVRRLRAAGVPVRGLSRGGSGHDLADPRSLLPALDGVDAVFLVFPSVAADAAAPELVGLLAERVRRVVYLSASGVSPSDTGGILGSHALLERLITEAGVEHTFLRPSGFAANTLGWADQLHRGDELRWFHGGARRALVHEDDLAAVGTEALLGDRLLGATPHLTGPAALSQVEQLAAIAEATGRPLRFTEVDPAVENPFPDFPPEVAEGIVAAHAAWVEDPEPVTGEVGEILGRPALPFTRWARDHAGEFRLQADPARQR